MKLKNSFFSSHEVFEMKIICNKRKNDKNSNNNNNNIVAVHEGLKRSCWGGEKDEILNPIRD